jgi:hypothetical protein
VLMWLALPATFRGDDWELIHGRSLTDLPALLRPFNEQWVLVPAIVVRSLLAVVGLQSYVPYLAVLLSIHIVAAAAVARLVRETSGPLAAVVAGGIALFLGVGNENLHQAFQIGMVVAVAAGLWAIAAGWLWHRHGVAALLLTIAVASHLIAVSFIAACVVIVVLQVPRQTGLVAWYLFPVMALAAWILLFDLPTLVGRAGSTPMSPLGIPGVTIAGPLAASGGLFGLGLQAGVLVLSGLVVLAILVSRRPAYPDLAAASIIAVLVEYAAVGLSRGSLGLGVVLWSRYLYAAVPLVIVSIAAWFGTLSALTTEQRRRAALVLVVLGTLAIVGNLRAYWQDRPLLEDFAQRERAAIAALVELNGVTQPSFDAHLPAADDLRNLIREHGSPLRDAWLPGVVGPVPVSVAREVCVELVARADVDRCLDVVGTSVGSEPRPN